MYGTAIETTIQLYSPRIPHLPRAIIKHCVLEFQETGQCDRIVDD